MRILRYHQIINRYRLAGGMASSFHKLDRDPELQLWRYATLYFASKSIDSKVGGTTVSKGSKDFQGVMVLNSNSKFSLPYDEKGLGFGHRIGFRCY